MAAVELLRSKGHLTDATNQFDQVLDDYDVSELDVLVFGGMVPADTRQYLRDEITKRNPRVTFVQGLVGIPESSPPRLTPSPAMSHQTPPRSGTTPKTEPSG